MAQDFASAERLFFEDPAQPRVSVGRLGVLYLLRRDINYCMGVDTGRPQALFPAAMAILAGVDLLAKFYKGTDNGGVGKRFKEFVKKYFQRLTPDEADQLYQFRNALMHSFGLYSETKHKKYQFSVNAGKSGTGALVEPRGNDWYFVGIQTLHERFEEAIEDYRNDLKQSQDLRAKFMTMWQKYGFLTMTNGWPT